MKNQPNKATVKDGLPTATQILGNIVTDCVPIDVPTYKGTAIPYNQALKAMQSYSDQQNAELLAKISQLEESYTKFAKERDEQYGEYIDLNVSLRNENAELRERVKELEGALTATLNVARAYDRSRFVNILDKAEKALKK